MLKLESLLLALLFFLEGLEDGVVLGECLLLGDAGVDGLAVVGLGGLEDPRLLRLLGGRLEGGGGRGGGGGGAGLDPARRPTPTRLQAVAGLLGRGRCWVLGGRASRALGDAPAEGRGRSW